MYSLLPTVVNWASVISVTSPHMAPSILMLSLCFFHQYSEQLLYHITIIKSNVCDPVAMTILNLWRELHQAKIKPATPCSQVLHLTNLATYALYSGET